MFGLFTNYNPPIPKLTTQEEQAQAVARSEALHIKRKNKMTKPTWYLGQYPDDWNEMMTRYKQIGGDHYKQTSIQPIDVIRDWKLGFELGSALKYIQRYDKKGKPKEDIEKAIHYLEMFKETLN